MILYGCCRFAIVRLANLSFFYYRDTCFRIRHGQLKPQETCVTCGCFEICAAHEFVHDAVDGSSTRHASAMDVGAV